MTKQKAVTKQGLALITKTHAGKKMKFTNIETGNGVYTGDENLEGMTGLLSTKQRVPVSSVVITDSNTARVRGILTNEKLTDSYLCTEIGVFAEDPDLGEILFCIVVYDEPNLVRKPMSAVELEEILLSIYVTVGNADNVIVTIGQSAAYATAADLEELVLRFENHLAEYVIDATLVHNLGTYPSAIVFEIKYGSGMGPCGETPCGGEGEYRQLNCRAVYVDGNRMMIALGKKYDGTPTVEEIVPGVFILMFESVALRVALQVDYATLNVLTEKRLEKLEEMEALEELRKEFNGLLSTLSAVLDSNVAELAALDKKIDAVPIGCGN